MKTLMSPLGAAILASLAMAAAPAFAQQSGSSSSLGGSAGHHAPLPTHLPKTPPKPKAAQKVKNEPDQVQPAPAAPQAASTQAMIKIDASSTYEDALTCYQFHGVSMQIANAMKGRANLADNQKAQYESVAKMSTYLQQKWFVRIGETGPGKTKEQLNTDLQAVAGGVVTDANAGLSGDAAAQARNTALRDKCKTFEKVEQIAAPG